MESGKLQFGPENKWRLLFSSLGTVALVAGLYFALVDIAYWLPRRFGDAFLEFAGPLGGLPDESVWAVQTVALRIFICGLCVLPIYGLFKLFHGRRPVLPFRRVDPAQKSTLYKHTVFYFLIVIGANLLFAFTGLGGLVEGNGGPRPVDVNWLGVLASFSLLALAGPFFEEVLFRGFLHRRLRQAFSFWPAFLISGVFFAVLHFTPGETPGYNLHGIGNAFVFAYFATRIFETGDNIWPAFFLHGLYNGWVAVWLFVEGAFA